MIINWDPEFTTLQDTFLIDMGWRADSLITTLQAVDPDGNDLEFEINNNIITIISVVVAPT